LAENRNGGMLRLIASRHDDDDDEPANLGSPRKWLLRCVCVNYCAGIARLCCDSRRYVRSQALTYLQRALLMHDLQTLSATEWESCFNKVWSNILIIDLIWKLYHVYLLSRDRYKM